MKWTIFPVKITITRKLVIPAGIIFAIIVVFLVFCLRSPVLVVIDEPFTAIYGVDRAKKARLSAAFSLYRPIKPVMVANDAASDVLVLSIEEASSRPYCVIFPFRYAGEARRYHEQNPQRRVLLLTARSSSDGFILSRNDAETDSQERFYVYTNDGKLDLFRAGRIAGIFGNTKEGEIPVFFDQRSRMTEREMFLQGLQAESCESVPRFVDSFAQLGSSTEFSTIVLAGSGMEYLDRTPNVPLIVFTWLDPALTSREIQVIFDDSPWAQLTFAVKMLGKRKDGVVIPSKIMIFPNRIADKGIIRSLEKAARSIPEKEEKQP